MIQEAGIDLVLPEGDEIPHLHVAAELVLQDTGIGLAHSESDEVAGIAEYALPDLVRELIEVLMGQDEGEPVLPGLREDRSQGVCREALELVDVEVEGGAGRRFRIRSLHSRPLELREEERAQEAGVVFAHDTLREVGDHDPSPVHEEPRIEAAPRLAHDVPHGRVPKEPPDLVLKRRDGFEAEAALVARVLVPPECADDRVLDLRGHALAEGVVREEPGQGDDRESAMIQERRERVPQDVFEPRTPARSPDPPKRREDRGDNEVRLIPRHPGQEVQAHRTGEVAWIEVQHLSRPLRGDRVQDLAGEVSMRIKETHTSPGVEVLDNEIPKQGALAESRLPDDVEVLRSVLGVKQNKLLLVRDPVGAGADRDGSVVHMGRAPSPSSPPRGEPVSSPERNLEARAWRLRVTPAKRRVVTERARQERWARGKSGAWFPFRQGGELRRRAGSRTRSVGPS